MVARRIAKKGAKKQQIFFKIYCFMCCWREAGYSVFVLSGSSSQNLNRLSIIIWISLMGLDNDFIREKSDYGDAPAFSHGAAPRHDADAAQ